MARRRRVLLTPESAALAERRARTLHLKIRVALWSLPARDDLAVATADAVGLADPSERLAALREVAGAVYDELAEPVRRHVPLGVRHG